MTKVDFSVNKSNVECYKIRSTKSHAWADITVDINSNAGRIQIASDFGSWSYYWGACGESFKIFLIRLDIEYAAGKFGESKWFDLDKTISNLKIQVKEYCEIETPKSHEEELLAEIKVLESESSCKEEFVQLMWDSPLLMQMCDNCPDLSYSISPQFQKFWELLWPVFVEELKSETSIKSKPHD